MPRLDYLAQQIQNGDIKAFETVFRLHYTQLCQFAYRYVNDTVIAEDIVQEFFYQYWKNRETMTLLVSVNAYLYVSVRNNCLNYLRHQNVRQKYAAQRLESTPEISHTEIQSSIEIKQLQGQIDRILNSMPERCSAIFRMSRYEGLKYREIAQVLDVSVKTVEADMGRALKALRQNLREYV